MTVHGWWLNYKALPKNNLHLPAPTCRPTAYNWTAACSEGDCVLDLLSGWRTWSRICINITVNFIQSIMHSHCIINVPEVEQLDGAGVWVTDACVGGLTVAAILTAQIHKSLLHHCMTRKNGQRTFEKSIETIPNKKFNATLEHIRTGSPVRKAGLL